MEADVRIAVYLWLTTSHHSLRAGRFPPRVQDRASWFLHRSPAVQRLTQNVGVALPSRLRVLGLLLAQFALDAGALLLAS